ncbi:hypothetical protein WJX73_008573 [Symbiochloris irregularis]|uniref:BZIP domain-containing protein n=1 Tax=Symbiochloris irregularis TaxID=706552 RepID=A0AAW1NRD3_9CHLO
MSRPGARLAGRGKAAEAGFSVESGFDPLDRQVISALASELASVSELESGWQPSWPATSAEQRDNHGVSGSPHPAASLTADASAPLHESWWPPLLTSVPVSCAPSKLDDSVPFNMYTTSVHSSLPPYTATARDFELDVPVRSHSCIATRAFPGSQCDPSALWEGWKALLPVAPPPDSEAPDPANAAGTEPQQQPANAPTLRNRMSRAATVAAAEESDSPADEPAPARSKNSNSGLSGDVYKASITARNRERQQRFRRRQKAKIAELEAQVATLSLQSKELDLERGSYTEKISSLSGTIAQRDQELMDANALLAQAQQQLLQQSGQAQQGAIAPKAEPEEPGEASLTLTLQEQSVTFTHAELQKLETQDVSKWWKEYVRQLASLLLLEKGGQLPEPSQERIVKLVAELLALMRYVWVSSHDAYEKFQAKGKMEEVHMPWEEKGHHRWRKLIQSLHLSPEQTAHMLQLRRHLRSRLQEIGDERHAIHATLLQSWEAQNVTGRDKAIERFKANKLLDNLKHGLRQENLIIREFVSCMYQQVLTPVQVAKCMVQAYPWYPDCQGIANWVAAESGEPEEAAEAAELLRCSPGDRIFDEHTP